MCVRASVFGFCVSVYMCVFVRVRADFEFVSVCIDGHCSVASSYVTLHIQLTYKYNVVTVRTTLLPRVSIQSDATRRSKGVSLELFRDLDTSGSGRRKSPPDAVLAENSSMVSALIFSIKKVVAAGGQWDWSMTPAYRY